MLLCYATLAASALASRGFAPRGDQKKKIEKKKKKKNWGGIFSFLGGLGVSHPPKKIP